MEVFDLDEKLKMMNLYVKHIYFGEILGKPKERESFIESFICFMHP